MRETLRALAQDHHKKMVDLAIAWILRQPALTGAMVGVRNEREAMTMASGVGWQLTPEELQAIEQALAVLA